ncbi:n-acetylglutamate synthase [Flagellimonas algicola]|uniref:N-acetylglutamate synthase n=1 Tax=Flagellimonas algicola TaxID=2583815 RepID=A0ABY2WP28_9FLAO|nr:n-acetylglutamate synthase [Allomuricauda algicola]TMU56497.1 n-acetylglutamate synthase [Allomuricauda algicola]
MNYHNKRFRVVESSANSDTTEETIFAYKQSGNIVTSAYKGGNIVKGHLIGLVDKNGSIDMRYHQVNVKGELMTGICHSTPKLNENGKIRLHEKWKWTSGDMSSGKSILEEL